MHVPPTQRTLRAVDIGSGRGGDLLKWATIEGVVELLSLDIDAERLGEAERRFDELRRLGYIPSTLISSSFQVHDMGAMAIPRGDGCASIVSCHFAIQRIASSAERLRFVLRDVARVLEPGGVFVAVLPSATRIRRLLQENLECSDRPLAIGDLHLRRRGDAYEYAFRGSMDWDMEHYVDEEALVNSLLELGFRPSSALRGYFLTSCQEFIEWHGGLTSQTALRVLRGALPRARDLATLSAFIVLLAVRGLDAEATTVIAHTSGPRPSPRSPSPQR